MNRRGRIVVGLSSAVLVILILDTGSPHAQPLGSAVGDSAGPAQNPPGTTKGTSVLLEVRGEGSRKLTFSAEEFGKLPHKTARARGHDGVESEYQGVPLGDLLARAGAPAGEALKGRNALSLYVVVEATDGYRALFSLAEIDSGFTDRVVLLADRRDGRPLSDREGPLQVIVPGERKHARWVRQVVRLVIGRA